MEIKGKHCHELLEIVGLKNFLYHTKTIDLGPRNEIIPMNVTMLGLSPSLGATWFVDKGI